MVKQFEGTPCGVKEVYVTEDDYQQSRLPERKDILLRAAFDILKKCDDSSCVEDVMGVTAFWDGTECDGNCLMGEIKDLLEID